DGDLYVAPIAGRWVVRSTLDGAITRSDDACVLVEGAAWCLGGLAAYGPDAVGELALGVDAAGDELRPARIDVRLGGRILGAGAPPSIPPRRVCSSSRPRTLATSPWSRRRWRFPATSAPCERSP